MKSTRHIKIFSGNSLIFEGLVFDLNNRFYSYPKEWTEEQILEHTKMWAESNGWELEVGWVQ